MFQKVEAPRFQDNWHMKVVSLSALRTGCLYLPGNIHGTHFCKGAIVQPEGFCPWKIPMTLSGLEACLTVHLPHEINLNANFMQLGNFIVCAVRMVPCGTIRTAHTTYAAALKTTTDPKTRRRKSYAATQHLMLLKMGVWTRKMSS